MCDYKGKANMHISITCMQCMGLGLSFVSQDEKMLLSCSVTHNCLLHCLHCYHAAAAAAAAVTVAVTVASSSDFPAPPPLTGWTDVKINYSP